MPWGSGPSCTSSRIFIIIAAELGGCDDCNEIELFGETKKEWIRKFELHFNHINTFVFDLESGKKERQSKEIIIRIGEAD